MTIKVKYQTTRDNTPVTEQWSINGRGWIVRPQGMYFVFPQYVQGLLDVLRRGRIIRCLPLINSDKLYHIKAIPNL